MSKIDSVSKFEFTPDETIIAKAADGSYVWGWLSVVEVMGKAVVDSQGDVIKEDELEQAAEQFMSDARVAKVQHDGVQKGEFIQSIVFTHEVQKMLKIDLGKVGWLAKLRVDCPETKALVKAGELASFSIGGSGLRTEMAEAA